MWKKELIKNKIYAVILMCIGALVIPWCDGDATFFLFSLMMGIPLFFAKENWIYEGEDNDGTSREETYSEIRTKSENHHIQSHKRAAQYSGTRTSIVDELKRKFLTKTARSQKQSILFFRDPFKLVPVSELAEISDKFTRNEIASSNEMRQVIGWKPSKDPRADELRNKNLSEPNKGGKVGVEESKEEPMKEKE